MIFNERILQSTLTLAEELHFGRAAAMLHVSQPALSGTIKELERQLGVCLFARTSRHVELTEAGRVFVAQARLLIEQGVNAVTLVRGSSPEVLGPLRIGYPPSINLRWLCSLISDARTDRGIDADLQFVSTEDLTLHDELTKRMLHAAFFAGSLCLADLECVELFREPFMAVLNSRHTLARSASLSLDQVRGEPVIWLRREASPLLFDAFRSSCVARDYRPSIIQEVRTLYECLEFARADLGITFLPASMQAKYAGDSVVFVPLRESDLYAEYNLAFLRGRRSSVVDRFVRFVQDYVCHNSPARTPFQ